MAFSMMVPTAIVMLPVETADAGNRAGGGPARNLGEVDCLVGGVAGEVDRIDATAVDDAEGVGVSKGSETGIGGA